MCEVPVFYATTHGQARRVAEVLAGVLRGHGLTSAAIDVTSLAADQDWSVARGAIVGASLHAGRHQKQAAAFIGRHRDWLNAHQAWFFSVSLGAASRRAGEASAVQRLAEEFIRTTGWHPQRITCVAGRLAYTQYGWLTRWMMRRIAAKEGGSTDCSRDHEYTDWAAVETFGRRYAEALLTTAPVTGRSAHTQAGAPLSSVA